MSSHFFLLMAGRGARFQDRFPGTAKPLIPIGDEPMYHLARRAVRAAFTDVAAVTLCANAEVGAALARLGERADVVVVDQTRSPIETAMRAVESVAPDAATALVFCDVDQCFTMAQPIDLRDVFARPHVQAFTLFQTAERPHDGKLRLDADGTVLGAYHRHPALSAAIVGVYGFRHVGVLLEACTAVIAAGVDREPVFPDVLAWLMSATPGSVVARAVARHVGMGTPEDLARAAGVAVGARAGMGASAAGRVQSPTRKRR
jgi:hypothetical protein